MNTIIEANKKRPFSKNQLVCPSCSHVLTDSEDGLICISCKNSFGFTNGFINLITDPDLKTNIIEDQYDEEHGLNDQRRMTHWSAWEALLKKHTSVTGNVLEIGAGSGYVSWGLLHHSHFKEIHISDISPQFLQIITERHDPGNRNAYYYLCDANQLPFQTSTMDCVIGNSVLHHFIHYERTLRSVHSVLKPKGKAFFFEPVQQGKAFISFIARLIWKIDSNAASPLFSQKQHEILKHISVFIVNQEKNWTADSDFYKLSLIEDKYIFDIPEMERLAHRIGFSKLHIENYHLEDFSYWLYFTTQLERSGFDREKLKNYIYVFNAVRDVLKKMIPESMTTPMVYLVFEK